MKNHKGPTVEVLQVFKNNKMYMITKDGTLLANYDVGLQLWNTGKTLEKEFQELENSDQRIRERLNELREEETSLKRWLSHHGHHTKATKKRVQANHSKG